MSWTLAVILSMTGQMSTSGCQMPIEMRRLQTQGRAMFMNNLNFFLYTIDMSPLLKAIFFYRQNNCNGIQTMIYIQHQQGGSNVRQLMIKPRERAKKRGKKKTQCLDQLGYILCITTSPFNYTVMHSTDDCCCCCCLSK